MKFQPFGYQFEIISHLNPANTKKAILAKKTGFFDAKNGARGWVAGPFICLWFSALDRYGPMLFGVISTENFGTRVHGRAGADLNGVLMFTLLIPAMAWLVFMMISEGQASAGQLLIIGVVFLVVGPLLYWVAHKDRKDAEPLVRFLRKTLSAGPARSKSALGATARMRNARLISNEDHLEGEVNSDAIENALMRTGNGDVLIIQVSEQYYIQTGCWKGAYILETREGGPMQHYQAVRAEGPSEVSGNLDDHFSYEEVQEALTSYISGLDMPAFIRWQPKVFND